MKQQLTIDRFEGEKAVLKTENGETIIWPKENLPADAKEGAVLFFQISDSEEIEKEKKDQAKNILNELLNIEKN
ncbi:MAG: DUF3006 domain-containing protein [Patescibacteria group bacterium]